MTSSRRSSIRNWSFPHKKGLRILGVDDAPFTRDKRCSVPVVGVVYRGCEFLEGCVTTSIFRDGWNATDRLIKLVQGRFSDQIHVIMLKGIALGGFNIVDIRKLALGTRRPVLVLMRKYPDYPAIRNALNILSKPQQRWKMIERAGTPEKAGNLYVQYAGMESWEIPKLLAFSTARGHIPEALRAAHIIAGGLVRGESRGRA